MVALHNTLPLLICGTVRAVMVYAFDYQQPVEEYGVYWNFFFTLAAVCAAGQVVKIPPEFSALAGALVLAAHQHFLTNRGIGEFIRGDTRGDDWHLLNKEGVFSLPGYYALYLMGVGVGNLLERSVLALHDARIVLRGRQSVESEARQGRGQVGVAVAVEAGHTRRLVLGRGAGVPHLRGAREQTVRERGVRALDDGV